MVLCPGVEVPKRVNEHHMRILAGAIIGVNCLGNAPGRRVLSLLSRPLHLKFQTIRFQLSLIFSVTKPARLGCTTARWTPTACLIITVVRTSLVVVIVNDIGKA